MADSVATASPIREQQLALTHFRMLYWQGMFSIVVMCWVSRTLMSTQAGLLGQLSLVVGGISNNSLFALTLGLVLLPLVLMARNSFVTRGLVPLVFATFCWLLFADVVVYQLYRVHLNNGMIINLLTTPGADQGYTLGGSTLYMGLGVAVVLLVVHFCFALWLLPKLMAKSWFRKGLRKTLVPAGLLGLILLLDKGLFAYGDLNGRADLTRVAGVYPLYQRLTVKKLASRFMEVETQEYDLAANRSRGALKYPKQPIAFGDELKKPNVIFLVVESARFDLLSEKIFPHTTRLAQRGIRADNHYSGGNTSRFGVFSIVYGIYGTYWHQILDSRRGPVLVDVLKDLDYDFYLGTAAKMTFPEYDKTCFVEVRDKIRDTWDTSDMVGHDREMTDGLLTMIDESEKPFMGFLFYQSPHQPYVYPPEHEIFTPVHALDINYVKLAGRANGVMVNLRNRFKNSLHYVDSLVGEVVTRLEASGKLENTLLFVVGDHGEEFGEAGTLGHNNAFNRYQTGVAMVAYIPGQSAQRLDRITSNLDLVPTVLEYMGVTNPVSDYSHGVNLINETGPNWVHSASWSTAAAITKDRTLVYGWDVYNTPMTVYDTSYQPLPNQKEELRAMQAIMGEVIKGTAEFLR